MKFALLPTAWFACLLLHFFQFASSSSSSPPQNLDESATIERLKLGISKLEKELKACKNDNTGLKLLEQEKLTNKRLQELLDAKDEYCNNRKAFLQKSHEDTVASLEKRIQLLVEQSAERNKKITDSSATLGAENDHLLSQLRQERKKIKDFEEQMKAKGEELDEIKETLDARNLEIDSLRTRLVKSQTARNDLMKWIMNPKKFMAHLNQSLSMLDNTEKKILLIKSMSEQRVSSILESSNINMEYSNYVSNFVLFAILLVPLLFTIFCAIKIRNFSLSNFVFWCTFYVTILFLLMTLSCFLLDGKPLHDLRASSAQATAFLILVLSYSYYCYSFLVGLLIVKQWIVEEQCRAIKLKHVFQLIIILTVGFYFRDGIMLMESNTPMDNFDDLTMWLAFFIGFALLTLTFWQRKEKPIPKRIVEVNAEKGIINKYDNKAEDEEDEDEEDLRGGGKNSGVEKSNTKAE